MDFHASANPLGSLLTQKGISLELTPELTPNS